MESGSLDARNSKPKRVRVTKRKKRTIKVTAEPKTVRLVLLKSMKLTIPGNVPSGKTYIFDGAGSEVDVNIEDKDILLSKGTDKACCPGSVGPTPYFQIVNG